MDNRNRGPRLARLARAGRLVGGLAAGLLAAASAAAADLAVEVRGLGSDLGRVHFGLYDDPKTFPDREGRIRGTQVPISNRRARTVFQGLRPGFYAVAVFHDENSNGEFDRGLLGIPLEDYGFSNGASAFLGPPAFESARVTVPERGVRITIRLD